MEVNVLEPARHLFLRAPRARLPPARAFTLHRGPPRLRLFESAPDAAWLRWPAVCKLPCRIIAALPPLPEPAALLRAGMRMPLP